MRQITCRHAVSSHPFIRTLLHSLLLVSLAFPVVRGVLLEELAQRTDPLASSRFRAPQVALQAPRFAANVPLHVRQVTCSALQSVVHQIS